MMMCAFWGQLRVASTHPGFPASQEGPWLGCSLKVKGIPETQVSEIEGSLTSEWEGASVALEVLPSLSCRSSLPQWVARTWACI